MNLALNSGAGYAPIRRAVRFGLVGGVGLVVNAIVQAIGVEAVGLNHLAAAVVATQCSSTLNFVLADHWVFEAGRERTGRMRRYLPFLAMNNAALLLRVPLLWLLVDRFGVYYATANVMSLALLTLVRFGIADRLIWKFDASSLASIESSRLSESRLHEGPAVLSVDDESNVIDEAVELDQPPVGPSSLLGDGAVDSAPTERTQRLVLAGVVAVGALLRTWRLMAVGFNSDEAVYASQAAGIAGDKSITEFFPIFRAHPVLFQAILSVPYHFGTSDVVGRLASVAFGLATIVLVFATARRLYGPQVALIAAGIVALMPYHVIVTRQVLLDGPMTFFATLTLYLMVRYVQSRQLMWLLAASCSLGLTTLAKETYVILVGSVFMFFALSPEFRFRVREIAAAIGVFVFVLLPFPITVVSAGKSETGKSYLSWQLFRRPNHDLGFYPATLPAVIGYVVLIGMAITVLITWGRRRTWRERLLLSWILVPTAFLEIWPVKGFHYLLAVSMPVAILAARGLYEVCTRVSSATPRDEASRPASKWSVRRHYKATAVLTVAALSLAIPSWSAAQPATPTSLLAGSGGVPGGREVGEWVRDNVPEGAVFMTVGPSMANLVQYYGRRRAYGLSVSPNPLNRNPSYVPIVNPDREIRTNNVQYLVWDAYSTSRSQFFGNKLTAYAERYNGRAVYSYPSEDEPVIVVYEVRP